jgi:protein TonB
MSNNLKSIIMKTIQQAYTAIFKTETIDDIVFEGRNTQYGAYALRKDYNNHLLRSFLAVFSLTVLIAGILFIRSLFINPTVVFDKLPGGTTIELGDYTLPTLPPPPPAVNISASIVDAGRFANPVVVDIATTDFQDFLGPDLIQDAPQPDGNGPLEYVKPVIASGGREIDTTQYQPWEVNEKAMFQGGTEEKFRIWMAQHINYPEDAAASNVKGTVTLKFSVNKEGNVCDVSVVKGIHPLVDKAAVEAVLSSPKWDPAKINGNKVKVMYYLPINFSLSN